MDSELTLDWSVMRRPSMRRWRPSLLGALGPGWRPSCFPWETQGLFALAVPVFAKGAKLLCLATIDETSWRLVGRRLAGQAPHPLAGKRELPRFDPSECLGTLQSPARHAGFLGLRLGFPGRHGPGRQDCPQNLAGVCNGALFLFISRCQEAF